MKNLNHAKQIIYSPDRFYLSRLSEEELVRLEDAIESEKNIRERRREMFEAYEEELTQKPRKGKKSFTRGLGSWITNKK